LWSSILERMEKASFEKFPELGSAGGQAVGAHSAGGLREEIPGEGKVQLVLRMGDEVLHLGLGDVLQRESHGIWPSFFGADLTEFGDHKVTEGIDEENAKAAALAVCLREDAAVDDLLEDETLEKIIGPMLIEVEVNEEIVAQNWKVVGQERAEGGEA
jgi:hypothetical protein